MSLKLRKALKDLSSNPKRTSLVVFAMILGIWGVGTVAVSYVILMNDLNANYQRTAPQQLVLTSNNFEKLNLEDFRAKPEIEAAEFRDFSLHRIEIRPDVWIPLWLYGVENFEDFKVARVFWEKGNKSPGPGTILMERDGKNVSDIKLGSKPRIRIAGKNLRIPVSGICFDPGQAPATQDAFVYTYTDKQTYRQLTGLPSNHRLIIRLKNVNSAQDVMKVSRSLVNDLRRNGIEIGSVDMPRFNEHPHQWQLNTLLFLIGAIGFLAFIMGAVLVSQLVRAIMANQVRQIGILKAIGATQFQLFRIYILMLLVIGGLSGIFAIPLAVKSGSAFAYFVAGKLNFDILTKTIPLYVYVILILASLLLPVLLSLPILLKGTRISVKAALSDYGISQRAGVGEYPFLKKLHLPDLLILAIRNSQRNINRLMVTIFAMAFGVAIFSTGFNVRQSLWELLSGYKNEMRYDVQVVLNNPVPGDLLIGPFKSLDNVTAVEKWLGGRGEIQSKVISTDKGAGIVALPGNSEFLKLKIREGRWLNASGEIEIVLNQQALALYKNPVIGSRINMNVGQKTIRAKIVGVTQQFERPKVYIDIQQYDSLLNPDHLVNTLSFVAEKNSYEEVAALKKNIEKAISSSNLDVAYVMSQAERVKVIYDHLDIILSTIILLSFLVLVVSAVGMASATGINIWERTREIGVMRAIGATPKIIHTMFLNEGMITSVISILTGLLLSYPLSLVAAMFFGNLMLGKDANLDYAFSPSGFIVTIVVTLLFGWLASRIPANSAIKISTNNALSYE
ncbi:MAG: FtsX-like permease family protein [Bacteroidetes bacterium]|nr:FtsX-like permease family protein [Bacteroidota bacterium]